jgi:hypothetical protein
MGAIAESRKRERGFSDENLRKLQQTPTFRVRKANAQR